jgi:hypothetical protein
MQNEKLKMKNEGKLVIFNEIIGRPPCMGEGEERRKIKN